MLTLLVPWFSTNSSSLFTLSSLTFWFTIFWPIFIALSSVWQNSLYVVELSPNLSRRLSHSLPNLSKNGKNLQVSSSILTVSLLGGSSYNPILTSSVTAPRTVRLKVILCRQHPVKSTSKDPCFFSSEYFLFLKQKSISSWKITKGITYQLILYSN